MRIRILSAAEDDLSEAYLFYERQAKGLGSYFLDSIFADIDSLAFFAGIHVKVFGYHRLLARRFPFAVYYRIVDNTVLIYGVLDCRRGPSWARVRLMKG